MNMMALRDPEQHDQPVTRVPPHDVEAEAAIIGTAIENADALSSVAGIGLQAEHFYVESHRRIFEGAIQLLDSGRKVDAVAVAGWLRDHGRLGQIGGAAEIATILDMCPFAMHIEEHAERVMGLARMRELILEARRIEGGAFAWHGDAQAFLDQSEHAIYQLARTDKRSDIVSIRDAVQESRQRIEAAANRGGVIDLPVGLIALDRKLAGLRRGEVTVVAARPGMGKTSLAVGAAINLAGTGHPVAVFSLEMPRDQITTRMCCQKAEISVTRTMQGMMDQVEWRQLSAAQEYLSKLPIWIDDTPGLSLLQLRAKARRIRAKAGRLGLIVIDYLQLMDGGRQRGQSRDEEVGTITKGIKNLARELDVPIIELAQLNRKVEERQDKRPMLSDLRESGSVEQDADNVVFIYRDDYYHADSKWKGTSELIVSKQRNGPSGRVRASWDGPSCTFSDLTGPNAENENDD